MVNMPEGLQLWSARQIADEFDLGVKRRKNSPLYQKLYEIQAQAKNPTTLLQLDCDEALTDLDLAACDWEDWNRRRWHYNLDNDDKTVHWWHLLNDEEQQLLNDAYTAVCASHYGNVSIDRGGEECFDLEFRYRFNPAWEALKHNISQRPKVRRLTVIDHGLVRIDSVCNCASANDGNTCLAGLGDNPVEAIEEIQNQASDIDGDLGIDYFDLGEQLKLHFGERSLDCPDEQAWGWTLEEEPSGVLKTSRDAGWTEESIEPIRSEFDSVDAFQKAFDDFENRWAEWEECERYPQWEYRICVTFSVVN